MVVGGTHIGYQSRIEVLNINGGSPCTGHQTHFPRDFLIWGAMSAVSSKYYIVVYALYRGPIHKEKFVTKIVMIIVTKSNFDSVTCVNYSFSPLS